MRTLPGDETCHTLTVLIQGAQSPLSPDSTRLSKTLELLEETLEGNTT